MNNEENTKQVWQTPEIIDLDVADKTNGKPNQTSTEVSGLSGTGS